MSRARSRRTLPVRHGLWVDLSVRPSVTYIYEISEETSISGEQLRVLTAEFLAEYALVFALKPDAPEATVIFLRLLP